MILEDGFDLSSQSAPLVIYKPALIGDDFRQAVLAVRDAGVRVTQVSEKRAAHVLDAGRERLHQQVRIPAVREPDAGQRAASPQIVLGHVVGLAQRESASGIVPLDEVLLGPDAGGLSW